MLPAGGNPIYYVEDLLGTSRVLTTNTGVVCYDADFYPYGGERAYTNTCPQNYKFEGKERDTETGNDDFGARYYSNRFGRWLSADWSAVPVPVPYANLTNPQTLNLDSMVADDPESFADLDGHCCEEAMEAGEQLWESPSYAAKVVGGLIILGAVAGSILSNPDARDAAAKTLHDAVSTNGQYCCFSEVGGYPAGVFNENTSDSKPGTLGKPDHQQTADEERAKRPGSEREGTIPTPGGEKNSRRGDVVVKDKSGKVTEVVQVIRPNKNGTAPAREVRAANDITATGAKVTFVPVRPIIPKPRIVDATPPQL
jgi:RHS repeat-associated protein